MIKMKMEYPKQNVPIYMFLVSGNKAKGMFYWNGGKPTFVSYGTEITNKVISWEYVNNKPKGGGKTARKGL
jgi:hypothetical protein